MLKTARQYVIKHKDIFMKAITAYASILPEVTRENTELPNTHILIDKRDKFFTHERNIGRKPLMEAVWKVLLSEYEHDIYYRNRFDWLLEELANSGWKPRSCDHPTNEHWTEPEPYGGGYLIKDETLKQPIFKRRMRILEE